MTITSAFSSEVTCLTTDWPLNRKLYIGDSSGNVSIFTSFSGSKLSTRKIHKGAVSKILYCAYNKHIITVGHDQSIRIFIEAEGQLLDMRCVIDAHAGPIVEGGYCWRSR
jgi:WD40 repeat protein